MNKSELIDAIAAEADLTKVDAAKALDAVLDAIVGKNPKTGEKLSIAATTVPKFTAGANFKAAVAKK